jgi:hypothetical protein
MASAWLQNSKIKPSGESQTYAEVSLRRLAKVFPFDNAVVLWKSVIPLKLGLISFNQYQTHVSMRCDPFV